MRLGGGVLKMGKQQSRKEEINLMLNGSEMSESSSVITKAS